MKETHLRLGLEQVDLKLWKKKWLDPNLINCVVLKMRRIGVSRNPIWNLQMKREKRLRRARILEVMKQTEVSRVFWLKMTKNGVYCRYNYCLKLFGKTKRETEGMFGNCFFPLFSVFKNNFLFLRLKNLFGNSKLAENKNCFQNSIYEGNWKHTKCCFQFLIFKSQWKHAFNLMNLSYLMI